MTAAATAERRDTLADILKMPSVMNNFGFIRYTLLLFLLLIVACSTTNTTPKEKSTAIENPSDEILKKYIGKKIIVIGKSVNMKLGAALLLENGTRIWIDKMEGWPIDFYPDEDNAKTLKVTGILIEKNDLPIFVQNENASKAQQGIPVPKETNVEEASKRFLLKKATWSIIK